MNIQKDIALSVKNLKTYFYTNNRCNKAVNGVSFEIKKGKTLCIVGESGCGKSVTAATIMQLLPTLSRIEEGEIIFYKDDEKINIEKLPRNGKEMRDIRGSDIAMIFQDPMTALNPVYTVGFQIGENLKYHTNLNKKEIREKTISLLRDMGIPLPEKRVDEYPHSYSGGMRQRAMIAMAMACNPKILIADEPTTALDVTIQAQIFELMTKLKKDYDTAIMLITHDMGVVAELADNVAVMYMGNIVESGSIDDVLRRPTHPYTKALLDSVPVLGRGKDQDIQPIKGSTPDPYDRPIGCQFAPRCNWADQSCEAMPEVSNVTSTHEVRCHKYKEIFQY
jgi:peptide/nickel transport system ATP-binding protein